MTKLWTGALAALLLACGGPLEAPTDSPTPDAPVVQDGETPTDTPEEAEEADEAEEVAGELTSNVTVYADALGSGWQDWSWATHSLAQTSPVHAGSRSIAVTFGPWTGLYFHHSALQTAQGDVLELYVRGGATDNPTLSTYVTVNGANRSPVGLNRYCTNGRIAAGAWTQCRVPLSALGGATPGLDGIVLMEGAGRSLPVMYVDSVRLLAGTTTPTPTPVSVALSPATATVQAGATQQFTATVSGSTNRAVTWSTTGGTVSTGGLYTAPAAAGTYQVVATSVADATKRATATVTVTAVAPPPPPPPAPTPSGGQWVSAYYVGYQKDLYPPERVDFSAITHLIVGRITPNTDGTVDTLFDTDNGEAMARTLSTRAHAAGRKALLMVGGAGEYQNWVGAASSANRARFVTNLLAAMDRLGYDGLDIDWEPVETADKPNLLALVQALRAARPGMLITFPIMWLNANLNQADPWYAQLAQYLDQVNIMSYEMVGPWDGWTSWHTSALTGHTGTHPTSVSSSLAGWASVGVPKAKLGMGIGFYGQAWRNISGPNQSFTSWSDFKASDNYVTYAYILRHYTDAAYRWDASAQAGYLTFSTPVDGDVRFISYESPQAIAAKGAFSRANGYGGTIIWTVNQGCINASTGQNPPLDAVRQGFLQ